MPTIVCNGKTLELELWTDPHRVPITEPSKCPVCGSPTTRNPNFRNVDPEDLGEDRGANLYCINDDCPGVRIAKIDAYIGGSKKGVGILDVGDKILRAMWDAELVNDPADLYTVTVEDLAELKTDSGTRVGRSRAEKIVANVAAKRDLPLHTFLGSLGVPTLGRRRVLKLAEGADGRLDALDDWLDDGLLAEIEVKGLGDEIRASIRAGINRVRPLIAKLLAVGVTVRPFERRDEESTGGPLAGKSFCFTGTRECIGEVEALGAKVDQDVRNGTTYLVQKDPASTTSKSKKAAGLGTKVIGLDDLKTAIASGDFSTL